MIEMRRAQLSFGDGLIVEEVSDLREAWMEYADRVLADEEIVAAVYEALAKRRPKSRSRGRLGTTAEVVLRLLVLKQIRNLSYAALEREVRANLVYRDFTRDPRGQRQDAGRQDHGAMGRGGRAGGAQADPRSIGGNSAAEWCRCGATNAGGHDCGGDQHPLSDRQHVVGGWGAGADPHHEENCGDRGRGRDQTARPQPQCETPAVRDRANSAREGPAQSGAAAAALSAAARYPEPGGGPKQRGLKRKNPGPGKGGLTFCTKPPGGRASMNSTGGAPG